MANRLISRCQILCATSILLTGCFETLQKEKKAGGDTSFQSEAVIENRFKEEIETLRSLSLSGSSLEGLWMVFYSESIAEEDGQSIGIEAWTLLEISHEAESASLKVVNLVNCSTDSPASYTYTISQGVIAGSSFNISNDNSFLYPPAKNEVIVTLDESGRMLEFSDYTRSGDDSSTLKMTAYKAQDSVSDSFGVFTLA